MKLRRIFSAALAVTLLLSGCGGAETVPLAENTEVARPKLAYVPIDDRTDNVERVVYLAESLGYDLVMPEMDLYKTTLDNQPRNANGRMYGDRLALLEWVAEQDAAGCDLFLLSVDQLLSGGLVNSRVMWRSEEIELEDGQWMTEKEAVDRYLVPLAEDANNQVLLLDSVMRLAPTVGYVGGNLDSYNALREYGALPRPHLSGEDLTLSNVIKGYELGADGQRLPDGEGRHFDAGSELYLQTRARKLSLSDYLLNATQGLGAFHFLIGVDDSSSADSIQTNEIAYLKRAVEGRGAVLSGVDDLGTKAVCKLYSDTCGISYSAAVRYFGGSEEEAACIYDAQPLTQIMDDHLAYFGVREVQGETADLQVLVLTQPEDEGKKADYYNALIAALNENEKAGIPTILVNAGNGLYGQPFYDALTKETNLGFLLGYSGFHDMAIVTGSALSFGLSRYLYLRCGDSSDGRNQKAFVRTLVETVVKDLCYKSGVRLELIDYIRNDLKGSSDNFYNPEIDEVVLEQILTERMTAQSKAVLKNFSRSNCIVALDPYETLGLGDIGLSAFHFPWSRVFEIRMTIDVGDFTTPHGGGLFS